MGGSNYMNIKKKSSGSGKKTKGARGDHALRDHLLKLLDSEAHVSFENAITGLPPGLRAVKPPNLPFSAWHLLEHLRIAQWDIVEFSVNPKHVSPAWPDGYWPEGDAPPSDAAWKKRSNNSAATLNGCRHSSPIRTPTYTCPSRTEMARRFFAKLFWWLTTTLITWGNWSWCAVC